jgi:hypothetical protein
MRRFPLIPKTCHNHEIIVGHADRVRLFLRFLPFVEAVGDDQAALAALPGIAKCTCLVDGLGTGIDDEKPTLMSFAHQEQGPTAFAAGCVCRLR